MSQEAVQITVYTSDIPSHLRDEFDKVYEDEDRYETIDIFHVESFGYLDIMNSVYNYNKELCEFIESVDRVDYEYYNNIYEDI